ncbi:hypothetical protein [Achromobacter ruhlandii]|uniref:hypothetical protein n=1 Tax=Achromobacter ruhlandii TaxID=72557 RepID=UPI0015828D5B|nr:hypothetical protein [Achromobacter ruhlandii]
MNNRSPFIDAEWYQLRRQENVDAIVATSKSFLKGLGSRFSEPDFETPRIEVLLEADSPGAARVNTPLGSAHLILEWRFDYNADEDPDDMFGVLVAAVQDSYVTHLPHKLLRLDWHVVVPVTGKVVVHSRGHELAFEKDATFQRGGKAWRDCLPAGMALYRALAEGRFHGS